MIFIAYFDSGVVVVECNATLAIDDAAANATLTNGDLTFTHSPVGSTFVCAWVRGTSARTGKAYWEVLNDGSTVRGLIMGIIKQSAWDVAHDDYPENPLHEAPKGLNAVCNGNFSGLTVGPITNGSLSSNSAYDFVTGDVIGFAVDFDAGKMWVSKNGSWIAGDPAAGTGETWSGLSAASDPYMTFYNSSGTMVGTCHFTPSDFVHTPPVGFGTICDSESRIQGVGYAYTTSANDDDLAVPAHSAGDLILVCARALGATIPGAPSGFTSLESEAPTFGNGWRVSWAIDVAGSITTVNCASAQQIMIHVYSGASGVGAHDITPEALGTPGTIPALTLNVTDGTSWVAAFGNLNQDKVLSDPAGLTFRGEIADVLGGGDMRSWDTAGGVASWASQSTTWPGASSAFGSFIAVEILSA